MLLLNFIQVYTISAENCDYWCCPEVKAKKEDNVYCCYDYTLNQALLKVKARVIKLDVPLVVCAT